MTDPDADVVVDSARRQKTRQRLMDAAFEVIAEQGVHVASIEMIAERAGFSRGAFYSNFESKIELFIALAERENDQRLERLQALVASLPASFEFPRGTDALAELVESFLAVDAGGADWCLILGEFRMLALRDPETARQFLGYQRRLDEQLGETLASMLASLGMEFTIEPVEFARLVAVVYESAVQEAILSGEPTSRARNALPKVVQAFTRQR